MPQFERCALAIVDDFVRTRARHTIDHVRLSIVSYGVLGLSESREVGFSRYRFHSIVACARHGHSQLLSRLTVVIVIGERQLCQWIVATIPLGGSFRNGE